ncbi:MAG: purine-nucleoside phosphorylase [Nitrospirota bacterium]|nr:purine-nucleoside phosphorylase [Nitrospirota bacterium]
MREIEEKAGAAADYLRKSVQGTFPVGVVLGSGLGGSSLDMGDLVSIPYEAIPGFPVTTVTGHQGNLLAGKVHDVPVLVMQGRFHLYEGYHMKDILLPLWTLHLLGVSSLILTNASGGINVACMPGDLVLVNDHINLMGTNPLVGVRDDEGRSRFLDMTQAYDQGLAAVARKTAAEMGIALKSGVMAAVLGPVYETPAEIGMMERMGADLVCMSTVPEVIIANYLGMRVLAISLVCNRAAGLAGHRLAHDEVLKTAASRGPLFARLLDGIIGRMASEGVV